VRSTRPSGRITSRRSRRCRRTSSNRSRCATTGTNSRLQSADRDGRGFLAAQLEDDAGRLLDLGTKGSGRTPWSRDGDGRLTLKGGVREVLATEMLEALGVYTSKTFSLFETGEQLYRGDEPSPTRSSVLVRLGHSHIRSAASSATWHSATPSASSSCSTTRCAITRRT